MYWTRPAEYATSGQRSPVTSRATCTKLLKKELVMKRPRARAGFTPISSRVRIVDAPAAVGVGGGEPCRKAGGGAGGDDGTARMEVVSGPGVADARAAAGALAAVAEDALAAAVAEAPAGVVRRCGRRAI